MFTPGWRRLEPVFERRPPASGKPLSDLQKSSSERFRFES
jgi:hypothetical protein